MSNLYMKVQGINGSVTTKDYSKWIRLSSLGYKVRKPSPMNVGDMAFRISPLPKFSAIRIIKSIDSASSGLLNHSFGDVAVPEIEIHLCASDDNKAIYKLLLKSVMFTEYSTQIHEGIEPIETITLTYSQLQQTHLQLDKTGKTQVPYRAGYNLEKAQAM